MKKVNLVFEEKIIRKIFVLRNERVMLDVHLAEIYGVETRALKQAVKRNPERFPEDLLFELNESEIDEVVSQNVIPHKKYLGGAIPFAFTETGIAMLSSVLKSRRAIATNLAVMRTFVALRKMALNHKELMQKLNQMEKDYDQKFSKVFTILRELINPVKPIERKKIGYKRVGE